MKTILLEHINDWPQNIRAKATFKELIKALTLATILSSCFFTGKLLGNIFLEQHEVIQYHLEGLQSHLEKYPLKHIRPAFADEALFSVEWTQHRFQEKILEAIPPHLKDNVKQYLPTTLKMARKYNIDPLWVLSIMWTESHYNQESVSHVGARGLMQIMPYTSRFIKRKMKNEGLSLNFRAPSHLPPSKAYIFDPKVNIEFGVYYLKYLLEFFNHDFVLATIAYNMGPYGVRSRLNRNLPVGIRNLYLNKVRKAYSFLSDALRQGRST